MDIGKLRDQIQLRRRIERQDDYGQMRSEPVCYATIWANVAEIGSVDQVIAQQLGSGTSFAIEARYRADVQPTDTVLFDGRELQITGRPINPDGKKIAMMFGAREWSP